MKEQIRTQAGMAQARQHQGGPLSLISCVSGREASPLSENDPRETSEMKSETKKKRFHPLRGLRRMFRRKARRSSISDESYKREVPEVGLAAPPASSDQRSRSTGRLLQDETTQNRTRNSGLAPGLSLSHDSIFTPDRGDSGHSSSDLENSSLSIPVSIPAPRFQAELADAVRRRNRGESEDEEEEEEEEEDEDLGLPRSPCSSLTTADVLRDKPQEPVVKSQSSCSEGSLLSMDSSDADLDPSEPKSELDLSVTSQKLSHSAAKHKMAIRPKRNHGAPQGKRKTAMSGTALPATPEVIEEPGTKIDSGTDNLIPESFSLGTSCSIAHDFGKKSASLPHGAALSSSSPKIVRSRSSATSTRFRKRNSSNEETEDENGETNEETEPKREESFFGRLLPRRSGKKKKTELDQDTETAAAAAAVAAKEEPSEEDSRRKTRAECRSFAGTRNVDRRQRIEPADVTSSPPLGKKENYARFGRSVSEGSNRMKISYSMSPPKSSWTDRVLSRSVSPPEAVWPKEIDGDEWADLRIKRYRSNWEESSKAIDRFPKKEIHEGNAGRRDFSPLKIRRSTPPSTETAETDPDARVEKSRCFGNFSVGVYGEERKRKEDNPEEETGKRLYTKNASPARTRCSRKEEKPVPPLPLPRKSASLESVGSANVGAAEKISVKSVSSESFGPAFSGPGVVITYEEPRYANLENFLPNPNRYEKVHHGYENIRIIELVKKEIAEVKTPPVKTHLAKTAELEPDKKSPAKPPVSEKPKEPKKDSSSSVPEFMRVQLNRVESRNSVTISPAALKAELKKEESARDVSTVKTGPVERRKSEPSPTAEQVDGKNSKPKTKSAKEPKNKSSIDRGPETSSKHVLVQKPPAENLLATEKTETTESEEVVLRKKPSVPSEKDDQPELMKVFARRSLKIKEDEELAEDVRKSRDSDKENDNSEPFKQERKRTSSETKKGQVSAEPPEPTAVKPPVKSKTLQEPSKTVKTSFFHRYGRSTSENGIVKPSDPEKGIPDKENILSVEPVFQQEKGKAWEGVPCDKVIDVTNAASEGSGDAQESGFKRIQQRKAEWERRMQQAAKR